VAIADPGCAGGHDPARLALRDDLDPDRGRPVGFDIDDDRQELAGEDQIGHADPNRNRCTGAATHGFGDEDRCPR